MNPGQTLKDKRDKMGLSINDVAVATKINPRILKALEEGQKENLPPRSFVRGFIRSYANYLKLNAEEILLAFETEDGIAAPVIETTTTENKEPSANKSSREDINRMEKSSRLGTIMVTAGIVFLIVLIFSVKKVMDRYAQERIVDPAQILIETPIAESATTEESNSETSIDSTKSDVKIDSAATTPVTSPAPGMTASSETIQPLAGPTQTQTTLTQSAEIKTATTSVATSTPVAPTVDAKPTAPIQPTPAATPATIPAAETKKVESTIVKQEIIVEALDQVQLNISVDGGGVKKITLNPESVHTIKAEREIVLEVSDGGLVNIIQNGIDRGNPSQLGKAAKLKYP